MSRIGKRPIAIPNKVTVEINGLNVVVKGPKGTLERTLPPQVKVEQEGNTLKVLRRDESRVARERHGAFPYPRCQHGRRGFPRLSKSASTSKEWDIERKRRAAS